MFIFSFPNPYPLLKFLTVSLNTILHFPSLSLLIVKPLPLQQKERDCISFQGPPKPGLGRLQELLGLQPRSLIQARVEGLGFEWAFLKGWVEVHINTSKSHTRAFKYFSGDKLILHIPHTHSGICATAWPPWLRKIDLWFSAGLHSPSRCLLWPMT